MNLRQIIATLIGLLSSAWAESPQDAARRTMADSISRQAESVAAMRLSVERQRAMLGSAVVEATRFSKESNAPPFFILSWPALGPSCEPLADADLRSMIAQAAQQEGVNADLLRAVAAEESAFRPCALSPKGAMGLMQLMPATARQLGVRDPYDAQENLLSGAHYLKQLLDRFAGNTAKALAAYNAGPARVEEEDDVPDIPETGNYVQQILNKLLVPSLATSPPPSR